MKFCERHNLIDRHSYVAQYISLAMLTIGVCSLLGSDDLLAAFACGTAFAWDGFFNRQTEESVFSSVIDLLFNVAAFVYVGAWTPFGSFQNAATTLTVWRLLVIAILVLLLRRLPVMIALYRWIPDIKTFREAVFSGHFGPIGIGAIFISTLANEVIHKNNHPHSEQVELLSDTIQPIVAFMVLCSITIHGLSIPSFSLGRRVHSVSRTWSRHAPPDWTNQARVVERGQDDIIINRDSVMERGELTSEGKAPESRTLTSTTPSVNSEKDQGSVETKTEKEPTGGKDETPPDGTATAVEWTEPHHKIIERRAGPGEDVEVEVTNEEGPPRRPSSLSGQIGKSLDGLKRTVGHLRDRNGEPLETRVAEIESEAKEALSSQGDNTTHVVHDDDDEEGWASDPSTSDRGSSTGATKKRSPKPRPTRSQPLGAKRSGRQRTSIRRSAPPPPVIVMHDSDDAPSGVATPTTSTPPNEGEPERRGRSNRAHFAPSTRSPRSFLSPATAGEPSSPRNHRLTHIKAQYSAPPTREASPARSVRFIDSQSPRSAPADGDDSSEAKTK
ncbi:hypothetical protein DXG03_008682 [Asterophora parasitica]|uniref:Cation/H+ exchanger transmembrane domain-containing protein n=1 Tax=Asterophora parasitica TaxID=117018 RepID=A0A9P7KCM6_9AGAR|nr:hypothetical protein DXG03_008682 [Asterophora parasitica]